MKSENKILGALLVSFAFIFASMENYGPSDLPYATEIITPFVKDKKGIYVAYRAYDGKDSKKFLDRDLVSRGYRPVQITIQNNTTQTYHFSAEGFSLEVASPAKVAWSVTKSSVPRSIAYRVLGFLFWPLMIPGTIDSIKTYHTHSTLKEDFRAKSIKVEGEDILPYSVIHRVAFVKEENFKDDFQVRLVNELKEEEIIFDTPEMLKIQQEETTLVNSNQEDVSQING